MAINPIFTPDGIKKEFKKRVGLIDQIIVRRLQFLGEKAVNMSRDAIDINPGMFPIRNNRSIGQHLKQRINPNGNNPTFGDYLDDTGNLRASIGYMVARNGKPLFEDAGTSSIGRDFARQLVREFDQGWVLIVYAGMDYAAAVESKGYNVISSAEHMIEDKIPELILSIQNKIERL